MGIFLRVEGLIPGSNPYAPELRRQHNPILAANLDWGLSHRVKGGFHIAHKITDCRVYHLAQKRASKPSWFGMLITARASVQIMTHILSSMDKDSPLLLLGNVELSKNDRETERSNLCYKTTWHKEKYAISNLNILEWVKTVGWVGWVKTMGWVGWGGDDNDSASRGLETAIDWTTRMRIAIDTIKGICFLHTKENIIHGKVTSSNILLDEQNNPKIADVGLSGLMTTVGNTNVIITAGTLGYHALELPKIKNASTKTDVYSLGVIILELLTRKSPSEAMDGLDLPQWVASIMKEKWTNEVSNVELIRDAPNIGDKLLNTLKLALNCVDPTLTAWPKAPQVL
ncbi:hypothetical protein FXO38_17840 [Capsicum annuum]|nr:hypothetical protein FXO38_17840 [Capsicum annuum]